MKKIQYSPASLEKLQLMKREIGAEYGSKTASAVIKNIMDSVKGLRQFEKKGPSVERLTGIPCEYRYLYVMKNYIFYRIDGSMIRVVDIYNEKEDFMWQLFGIKTTTKETEDYWKE